MAWALVAHVATVNWVMPRRSTVQHPLGFSASCRLLLSPLAKSTPAQSLETVLFSVGVVTIAGSGVMAHSTTAMFLGEF